MSPSWSRRIFAAHRLPCSMPAGFIMRRTPACSSEYCLPLCYFPSCWRYCDWRPVAATRWRLAAALALVIVCDVIIFAFHYPRNSIVFSAPLTAKPADLDRVATEWAMGNYVRIAVVLTTVILVFVSLVRISRDTASSPDQVTAPAHWVLYSNWPAHTCAFDACRKNHLN